MRWAVSLLLFAPVTLVSMVGCNPDTRYRVLTLLFEEVPPPGEEAHAVPVVRSPRRAAPPTPTPVLAPEQVARTSATANPSAALTTWDDVTRLLPKDQVGNPDWVGALEEKVITPRPGVAPEAREQDILALDVELIPKSDPAFKVIFSHRKHGQWLACSSCHSGMFEMKSGATPMTGKDVHGERYCGACHGKVAFDIVSGCPLCHLQNFPKDASGRVDWSRALADNLIALRAGPRAKSADQPTLDLDVVQTPEAQPALKSLFSHTTHTKWLACANCHPRPFPLQAREVSTKAADWHSRRYCGACHGSVAFGMIGFCGRCHPALEKARQHEQVLDLDTEITKKSQPAVQTVFSHKIHRWVECATCHSNLFETTAATTQMPMADIYQGKYCASCHGKVTSDLVAPCQRCHTGGDGR